MDPRLFEQRPAPALAGQLVASHLGHVRGERQVELRRDMGEHLVAALAAGGHHRARPAPLHQLGQAARPGVGRVGLEALVLGDVRERHGQRLGRRAGARADEQRLRVGAGERQRLER